MSTNSAKQEGLKALEARLKTLLPEEYQDCYEEVEPVSMGSADLKYGSDGKVAWDDMWATFCDLAMAGGPPHKGKLLEPGSEVEIEAQPDRYRQVVAEIRRGVAMVTEFSVNASPVAGWVRVDFENPYMAQWLVRAIAMENVSARCEGTTIDLPAGPAYRIEKEIKNVVTVAAKTCHYWVDHMWPSQQRAIANLFARLALKSAFIQPTHAGHDFRLDEHKSLSGKMADAVLRATGLAASDHVYAGWLGVVCPDVRSAIWMMRALVASNVVSRREESVLFLPVNPATDPDGGIVVGHLAQIYGFAKEQAIL